MQIGHYLSMVHSWQIFYLFIITEWYRTKESDFIQDNNNPTKNFSSSLRVQIKCAIHIHHNKYVCVNFEVWSPMPWQSCLKEKDIENLVSCTCFYSLNSQICFNHVKYFRGKLFAHVLVISDFVILRTSIALISSHFTS